MRKINVAVFCISALLWASCSQNDFTPAGEGENQSGEVNIDFAVGMAQGPQNRGLGVPQGDEETNKISRVEIYAFNAGDGKLDRKKAVTDKTQAIDMRLTKGEKIFYAVANATNEGIATVGDLLRVSNSLAQSQVAPFVMISAPVKYNITESDEGKTLSLTVARLVSRIELKYETAFENPDDKLIVDSVYIMKANSVMNYKKECTTLVNGGWIKSTSPYFAQYLLSTDAIAWTETPAPFDGKVAFQFYVFPNEAPLQLADATSIVITGKYNGKRTYYRVDVNVKKENNDISYGTGTVAHQYVKSNTIYSIKATIKGEGTEVPTVDPINISFWVQAADWNYVEQSEEF